MAEYTKNYLKFVTGVLFLLLLTGGVGIYFHKKKGKEKYDEAYNRTVGWSFDSRPITDEKKRLLKEVREEWVVYYLYWGSELEEGKALEDLGYSWDIEGLMGFWGAKMPPYSWVSSSQNQRWMKHYETQNEFFPKNITYYHDAGVLFAAVEQPDGMSHAILIEDSDEVGLEGGWMMSPKFFYRMTINYDAAPKAIKDVTLKEAVDYARQHSMTSLLQQRQKLEEGARKYPANQSILRVDNIERKTQLLNQAWATLENSFGDQSSPVWEEKIENPPTHAEFTIRDLLAHVAEQTQMKAYLTSEGFFMIPMNEVPPDSGWIEIMAREP